MADHETWEPDDPERYEELEGLADTRQDELGIDFSGELLSAINKTDAIVESDALVARADAISTTVDIAAGEDFADDAHDESYDSLTSRVALLTDHLGDAGRRRARERFLAMELGFVAADRKGATADRILALVSSELERGGHLPPDLDPAVSTAVERLANCWTLDEAGIFERLASRFAADTPSGLELGDHVVYMSLVADLRTTPEERVYLWNDRTELVAYVEDMIEGMTPGDPVDIETIYLRAEVIRKSESLPPPQVAELTRLALAALAGEHGDLVHAMADATTAKALADVANDMTSTHDKLEKEKSIPASDPRLAVIRKGDYDLGDVWKYLWSKRRVLPGASHEDTSALDQAMGSDVAVALTGLSAARRGADPSAVVAAADTLRDALDAAEARIRKLIDPQANLNTTFAAELDALSLLNAFRFRATVLCTDVKSGLPPKAGPYDALIATSIAMSGESIGDTTRMVRPERLVGGFDGELGDKGALPKDSSVVHFRDALEKWCDAAQQRRVNSESRPDPMHPETPVLWPGLADGTRQLLAAAEQAREVMQSASPADRSRLDGVLRYALRQVASRLRSVATVEDPVLAAADPLSLAELVDDGVRATFLLDDPAKSWLDESQSLLAKVPPSPDGPNLAQALAGGLADWQAAVRATPPTEALISSTTWQVLGVLSDYRNRIATTVSDKDLAQQFLGLFDRIGLTVAYKLGQLSK